MTTTDSAKHAAYADDTSYVGKLRNILTWWNKLNIFCLYFGYLPRVKESRLAVRPRIYETAKLYSNTRH